MKISVIGAGYLGATHAICMASLGHKVIAVDVDPQKVALLNTGVVPFYEPGLTELLGTANARKNLTFTTDYSDAANCDISSVLALRKKRTDFTLTSTHLKMLLSQLQKSQNQDR